RRRRPAAQHTEGRRIPVSRSGRCPRAKAAPVQAACEMLARRGMRNHAWLALTPLALAAATACSDRGGIQGSPDGGAAGGSGGAAGGSGGAAGGDAGTVEDAAASDLLAALAAGQASWAAAKGSCATYQYVRFFRSVFGGETDTTVQVANDHPTFRSY